MKKRFPVRRRRRPREFRLLNFHFQNAMHERLQRKLRLLKADAGSEAPVRGHPTQPATPVLEAVRVRRHLRLHHDGNKNLRRGSQFHAVKAGLRDSDNGHRVTVEGNRPSDDAAVAVEVAPARSYS
jgi:hypothetical protein